MALIKCPECGKEISDKSSQCIHCGYPLQPQPTSDKVICTILGEDFDLTFLDELLKQWKYYQLFLSSSKINNGYFTKHNMKPLTYLWHYIDEHDEIPKEITQQMLDSTPFRTNLDLSRRWKQWEANPQTKTAYKSGQVVCPKCGSVAITTGQRGFSLMSGFIGANQTMNRCAKCGYKWKPKG